MLTKHLLLGLLWKRKFKGGSQQISERLAQKLGDSIVITNSPVVGINQEAKDYVLLYTLKGREYKMKIHFTPSLPPLRNQMMQRMPMGTVMKVILYYETAFWRAKGLCGSIYIEGGDEHPVYAMMDDTKPDGITLLSLADKTRRLCCAFKAGRAVEIYLLSLAALAEDCPGSHDVKANSQRFSF
ncbi:amine oxidase [Caerostris extrusa]|uniref:monoamine oxidase n=1 Tax=Caerostris extrusa TaxID=172846 RepID=A0AAV4QXT9_CAEEX|nr:amine oxidase [Caerostris extrusa]